MRSYYVYSCDENKFYEVSRRYLYNLVKDGERGIFGNHPQQKRMRYVRFNPYYFERFASYYPSETKLIDFIAYDSDFNLIDFRVLEDWAYNNKSSSQFPSWKSEKFKDHKFRQEPVEYTSKSKWRYSDSCKVNLNLQRRRLAQDEEHKPFINKKDKVFRDPWDEVPKGRRAKRSWKESKKVRKQYMKNL